MEKKYFYAAVIDAYDYSEVTTVRYKNFVDFAIHCWGDECVEDELSKYLDGDDEWMEVLAANREFCGAGILADVLGDGEGECPICIGCLAPVSIAADGCCILIGLYLYGLCRCREGKGNDAVLNPVRRKGCGTRCCQRCDDIILCSKLEHEARSKEQEREDISFHSFHVYIFIIVFTASRP